MFNQCFISGRVFSEPELDRFQSGTACCTFQFLFQAWGAGHGPSPGQGNRQGDARPRPRRSTIGGITVKLVASMVSLANVRAVFWLKFKRSPRTQGVTLPPVFPGAIPGLLRARTLPALEVNTDLNNSVALERRMLSHQGTLGLPGGEPPDHLQPAVGRHFPHQDQAHRPALEVGSPGRGPLFGQAAHHQLTHYNLI